MQMKNKGYKIWEVIITGYDHLVKKNVNKLKRLRKIKQRTERGMEGEREIDLETIGEKTLSE